MAAQRLTGRQITTVVVAICAAIALAPAGVYATATFTNVKVVDAINTARAARVSTSGRLLTDVEGAVTATSAAPARAFSVAVNTNQTIAQAIPAFTSGKLMITSITAANSMGSDAYAWIYRHSDATCTDEEPGFYTYLAVKAGTTESASFPTPLIVTQKCAWLQTGGTVMTITGYRIP